jgi:VIT1/CCC1 family predicted Fe2+/Mn2+ transporter
MATAAAANSGTLVQKIKDSLLANAGNVVFGMEDGAAAAAVSMMAGAYLDAATASGREQAEQNDLRRDIEQNTAQAAQNVERRLQAAGFTDDERSAVVRALEAHPATWLQLDCAVGGQSGAAQVQSPLVQSLWMFVADLLAAAIPVIPFALLPLASAQALSAVTTLCLLVALGLGRARVTQTRRLPTVIQTVGIATSAAIAGLLVGKLVSG